LGITGYIQVLKKTIVGVFLVKVGGNLDSLLVLNIGNTNGPALTGILFRQSQSKATRGACNKNTFHLKGTPVFVKE
jgi:hypothetical protein